MPVAFLTDDHLARYGRYGGDPTPEQLTEHFYLHPAALERLALLRHDHTRLGFALQLCTLRFLGTFLQDPLDVPLLVLKTVAQQLGMTETLSLHRYLDRRETRFDHQRLIRDYLGYKDFAGLEVFALIRSIYAQLRLGDERPISLFDQATKTLALRKVILPGATVLARLIIRIRDRTLGLLYRQLSARLNPVQRTSLEDLLILPEGSGRSPLEKLRTPPTRVNAPGLVGALERVGAVRAVGVGEVKLNDLPPGRLLALSRHALLSWTQTLARLSEPRRLATLLAFMQYLERSATDDALELFDTLMSSLAPRGERKRNKERLRTLRDLDAAALVLRDVGRLVLDEKVSPGRIRKEAFKNIGQDTILAANTTVTELVQEDSSEETENWLEAVHVVTRFLPTLLSTLKFEGTPGMKPLLEAIIFLQKPHRTKSVWRQAPRDFIPKSWESRVLPLGRDPDRGAYSVCVAYLVHAALKRRDLFVERSHRFGDPRIQLLQGANWEALRGDVCRTLNLSPVASEAIQTLTFQLEAAYRRTLEGLPDNAWVRFETQDGRSIPVVQALEPQENTTRLEAMSDRAYSFIPDVDLSELLLEIHAQTGFANEFSLASEGEGRVSDFAKSLCAVLVSQACNIGLKAVSRPGIPALSLGRLSWVQQNYLRADTLIRANARLVEAHTDLPLSRKWGDGEVASADGLRFVVSVRTVYSRPNSKYFGAGRGITYAV